MTATVTEPVVATAGSTDPRAPLVVLLHGRGSAEGEIIGLAGALPAGAAYAAVQAGHDVVLTAAPVDAGSLRYVRSLEELAFLNISLNAANG